MANATFRAQILNPVSNTQVDFYDRGQLIVNDKGRILELSNDAPKKPDLEGRLIIPGFIDTHVHLPQYHFLGEGLGLPLLEWLQKYTFPTEMRFSNDSFARAVANKFFDDLISHGTTTALVYSTIHKNAADIAFQNAAEKGLRAIIGKVMMDRNSPEELTENTAASMRDSIGLYQKWNGFDNGRLQYVFTPRFAPTCTERLMESVGEFARRNDAFVQTHLSENTDEIAWVNGLFPGSGNYTQVYDSLGLTGQKVIMAHSIHLNDDEVGVLKSTNTKIAHCPYSNQNLLSGTMQYFRLSDNGLVVGLGTDVAGGPSISMFVQMGKAIEESAKIQAQWDGRVLSPTEAFYLATLGGAKVLSMDNVAGNLAVGKEADFLVINKRQLSAETGKPTENLQQILEALCSVRSRLEGGAQSEGKSCVMEAYVRGKRIYQAALLN